MSIGPSAGGRVRILQDGFWDLTEVIALGDGSLRVRKSSKGAAKGKPWGLESLRREIRYLQTLSPGAAAVLPPLLASWDRTGAGGPEVGYEMPYYPDHRDAGVLAREGVLSQEEIDQFQRELAQAVLERLHEPAGPHEVLSAHMVDAVRHAFAGLAEEASFAALIDAPEITLNGRSLVGPRTAFERIVRETDLLSAVDAIPAVRLHGDLFLENILWRAQGKEGREPRLLLIDPVSVAGVAWGPPLWDLVKYESYATGELMGLRSQRIEVSGYGDGSGEYRFRLRTEDPAFGPFLTRDWHGIFRAAFEARHGRAEGRAYRFIHGYFNAAMALNVTGLQRQGRLLRAAEDFNAVLQ